MPQSTTVLIVDDNPLGRATLEELLYGFGYRLAFAANGPEALRQAAVLSPDVILLDVMMPGMDGYEVCRRLRADGTLAEVPVVMVTALDDQESRLRGLEAGADDFVSKPFNRAELRARVKSIVRLNRFGKLRDEYARFRWMADTAADGYLLVDERDQVLYANRRAQAYLGLDCSGALPSGATFLDLARKHYQCESEYAWRGWPQPVTPQVERYLVRPDTPAAAALWLHVGQSAQPSGAQVGYLVRLEDVTAQMSTRRDTRTFQAMVSHKLRTPFSVMFLSVKTMAEERHTLSPDELAEFAEITLQSFERLQDEIKSILTFADASQLFAADATVPLDIVPELTASLGEMLGVPVTDWVSSLAMSDYSLGMPESALHYIVHEILGNARKFHPRHTPTMGVWLEAGSHHTVRLRLRDDGVWLPPDQLAKVWTPYYQGDKDFTGQVAGMGLGLPTVASIVWQAGGTCRLYNREDCPGVVVEITLPLLPAPDVN